MNPARNFLTRQQLRAIARKSLKERSDIGAKQLRKLVSVYPYLELMNTNGERSCISSKHFKIMDRYKWQKIWTIHCFVSYKPISLNEYISRKGNRIYETFNEELKQLKKL